MKVLLLTGGAGFIGSAFLWYLNCLGKENVLVVDHLGTGEKWKNLVGLKFYDYMEKDHLLEAFEKKSFGEVEAVVHLGATSSTTEKDASYLVTNNYRYSVRLFEVCKARGIPFYYASSAATYGDGSFGFADDEEKLEDLQPLNMYAMSKQMFDLYVKRRKMLNQVVGWKFFNVFGPNEYHKGEMRSMVLKAYEQIQKTGKVRLFKSYRKAYRDGEQVRDFLYIKDCVKMMAFFLEHPERKGIYNIGSGVDRTWNELVAAVFRALGKEPKIEYFEMPEDLKGKYQYYTRARMDKLRRAGFQDPVTPLEEAASDYVQNYLRKGQYLGTAKNA